MQLCSATGCSTVRSWCGGAAWHEGRPPHRRAVRQSTRQAPTSPPSPSRAHLEGQLGVLRDEPRLQQLLGDAHLAAGGRIGGRGRCLVSAGPTCLLCQPALSGWDGPACPLQRAPATHDGGVVAAAALAQNDEAEVAGHELLWWQSGCEEGVWGEVRGVGKRRVSPMQSSALSGRAAAGAPGL